MQSSIPRPFFRRALTWFAFCVLLAFPAQALAQTTTCNFTERGTTQLCTISYTDSNGPETRTLRLHIPTAASSVPPVVVYLHGAHGGEYECDPTGWPTKCDAEGCVLVCPRGSVAITEGTGGYSWNSLYPSSTPDDVAYLGQLLSLLESHLGADPKRLYMTGFSAGGWMTHRMGYESTQLAAIGVISSSLYIENVGASTMLPATAEPLSVIFMQGTADPEIFYCGESSSTVNVASEDDTFAYWSGASGNRCTLPGDAGALCSTEHGTNQPGGTITTVTQKAASGCTGGVDVQFYKLAAGNHRYYGSSVDLTTAPGTAANPYNAAFGATVGTNGADILWNFFAAHPKGSVPSTMDAGAPDAGADSATGPADAAHGADAGSDSPAPIVEIADSGASSDTGEPGLGHPLSSPGPQNDASGCHVAANGGGHPALFAPFWIGIMMLGLRRARSFLV